MNLTYQASEICPQNGKNYQIEVKATCDKTSPGSFISKVWFKDSDPCNLQYSYLTEKACPTFEVSKLAKFFKD